MKWKWTKFWFWIIFWDVLFLRFLLPSKDDLSRLLLYHFLLDDGFHHHPAVSLLGLGFYGHLIYVDIKIRRLFTAQPVSCSLQPTDWSQLKPKVKVSKLQRPPSPAQPSPAQPRQWRGRAAAFSDRFQFSEASAECGAVSSAARGSLGAESTEAAPAHARRHGPRVRATARSEVRCGAARRGNQAATAATAALRGPLHGHIMTFSSH